jgi:uncharacterized repeat protein (TIGR03803 family)
MRNRAWELFLVLVILAAPVSAVASVGFAITPNAISNTYDGIITLQISGLTNSETVVVQKFLDANTNGIVDTGDYLLQQFNLTDGQMGMVIGGVTNFNVPGDTDGITNGQILATLNFQNGDFVQNIVGQYIFVLSSPVGHFAPITNFFNVTNFPYAQKFTGNVVNNGINVPNAVVLLSLPPSSGNNGPGTPVAGVVANDSGVFSVQVPAGSYVPFAVSGNFVVNYSASPVLTLGSGATINTNLNLTNATQIISGQIVDAINPGIGLPGIFTAANSSDDGQRLIAVCSSDTNGNFTTHVSPGQWGLGEDDSGLIVHGYVGWSNKTNVNAGTTGITLAFPKATALFYGRVTNNSGSPLANVDIGAYDNNNLYESDAYTETNGNYVLAVLGLGSNDPWQVQYNGNATDYIYSQPSFEQNGGTNLNAGQAIQVNFNGILATNYITGNIQFNGNPVAGVGVNANATIHGLNYNVSIDTDSNGNYSLNVANANWNVGVNCNGGNDSLENILGIGNYQCPDNASVTIHNDNGTANFVVQPAESDQIFGFVGDIYGDPIESVNVYANDDMGDVYTNTTDNTGYYSFTVPDGNWDISVDCGQLNNQGYQCINDQYIDICCGDTNEADFTVQFLTSPPNFAFTTLYSFSALAANANSIQTNSDGAEPQSGLVLSGNTLYGTAPYGGTNGAGTVFAVNTNVTGLAVVHTFSATTANVLGLSTNGDGANPYGDLILLSNTLYGTAGMGGMNGAGTVFAVNTDITSFAVLDSFSAASTNSYDVYTNSDGGVPEAGLTLQGGIFYGTAGYGGTNGNGTVFLAATNGTGFKVLYTFSALDTATQTTNDDGANPYAGLVLSGNTLYGTTINGGAWGYGTIFSVSTNGTGFSVLYTFTNGNDGAHPYGGLILLSNTLFGTAEEGGYSGNGTVFSIDTNGTGFTVLHAFTGGNDGANPYAGLTLSSNTLYGAAQNGGSSGYGTIFSVNSSGGNFTVLHNFTNGNDGAYPLGDVVVSNNFLYGTAESGGNAGNGTVFALSLSPIPPDQIFGYVTDGNGNPISGVNIDANDGDGDTITNLTDDTGYYSLNVNDGNWTISVDCDQLNSWGYPCPTNQIVSICCGNSIEADFVTANQIFGFVANSNGIAIPSVNVYANNGAGEIYTNTTDGTGRYSFYVNNGAWDISVDCGQLNSQGYPCFSNQDVSICCGNDLEVDFGPVTDLIMNGGFETGNFMGWTLSGNTEDTSVSTGSSYVHSGNYGAQLGPVGTLGYLSQNFMTLPGTSYLLSFWLNSQGGIPNQFLVSWNGTTLFDQTNIGVTGWTNMQYVVTATTTNSILEFGFRNDPNYFGLDDISLLQARQEGAVSIIKQPQSLNVFAGVSSSFSVFAAGMPPLFYQWQFNGTNLTDGGQISGSQSNVLTLATTTTNDIGNYQAVISNTYGSVTSLVATLSVTTPPDLVPIIFTAPTEVILSQPDPAIVVAWAVTNQGGSTASGGWYDTVWFSTNGVLDTNSINLGDFLINQSLPAGNIYTETNTITLPMTASGNYTLFVQVDSGDTVYESSYTNNVSVPINGTFTLGPPPDLVPVVLTAATNNIVFDPPSPQSPTAQVNWTVDNAGLGTAPGYWYDTLYISTNTTISGAINSFSFNEYWATNFGSAPLPAGGQYTLTNTISLPQQSGTYYLILYVNAGHNLFETNYANNVSAPVPITVDYQVIPPDLAPVSVVSASNNVVFYPTSPQSPTVPVVSIVTNQGPGVATNIWGFWYDTIYISTNTSISGAVSSQDLGVEYSASSPLLPGGSYTLTNTVTLSQQSGTYYIIYEANSYFLDGYGYYDVYEANTNNNVLASAPVTLTYQVRPPDLAVLQADPATNNVIFYPNSPQSPTIQLSWAVTNQGVGPAIGDWYDTVYISTNNTIAGAVASESFWQYWTSPPFAVGDEYDATNTITLPQQSGTYYLIASVDDGDYIYESDKVNNVMASSPVTLAYQVEPPDLAPVAFVAATNNIVYYPNKPQSPTVQVSWTATNEGTGQASGYWYDAVYVSTNATIAGAISSSDYSGPETLQVGSQYGETNMITLPQQSGVYYLILSVNDGHNVYESNYANNVSTAIPVTVDYQLSPPDLAPIALVAPTNINLPYPNPTVQVSWSVTNEGVGAAIPYWFDTIWFSTNGVLDSNSVDVGDFPVTQEVPPGGSYAETNSVTLPMSTNGNYTLFVHVDNYNFVYESNKSNNISTGISGTFTIGAVPDLAATEFSANTSNLVFYPDSPQSPTVQVSWTVANQGVGPALGNWYDTIYISTNDTIAGAVASQSFWLYRSSAPLSVGSEYQLTNSIVLPQQSGTYYLILSVNDGHSLYEANYANNTATEPITLLYQVLPPDLVPLTITAPAITSLAQANPMIMVTWGVTNQGAGNATGMWYDRVWFSTDGTLDSQSVDLGDFLINQTLPSGGSYWKTNVVTLPLTNSGNYELFVQANVYNQIYESNISNNISTPFTGIFDLLDLPELAVTNVSLATNGLGGAYTTINYTVLNQGLGSAGPSFTTSFYLSSSPTLFNETNLLGSYTFDGTLSAGQFFSQASQILLPTAPGSYWVVIVTDSGNQIQQTSRAYNAAVAGPIVVSPSYTAIVQTAITTAIVPTNVLLTGNAVLSGSGQPAPFVPVNIHIYLRGTQRIIQAITDGNGNFSTTFTPLPGEAGVYQIGAAAIGVADAPIQATFTLLGMGANPQQLSANLFAQTSYTGQVQIVNFGEVPLTGLSVNAISNPPNISVSTSLTGGSTLPGLGTNVLNFTITASDASVPQGTIVLGVTSAQGATVDIPIQETVTPLTSHLVAIPGSLSAGMVLGQQSLIQFALANIGGLTSGPVTIQIPAVPWLSVASTNPISSIGPGGTNIVTLQLLPTTNMAFGPYRGSIIALAGQNAVTIPFTFNAVADASGSLQVTAVDEFTYYAAGSPKVTNAAVMLTDPVTGTNIFSGVTDGTGQLTITNITAGEYNLSVQASGHGAYNSPVQIPIGQTNDVLAFLPNQLVSYTWVVTPTTISDTYTFQLNLTFQTSVPVPVVTIYPPSLDLSTLTNATNQVSITITNHGLIAAQGLHLSFGGNSQWQITPLINNVASLPAMSSLTVPVTIVHLQSSSPNAKIAHSTGKIQSADGGDGGDGSDDSDCSDISGGVEWYVPCGDNDEWSDTPIYIYDGQPEGCATSSGGGGGGGEGGGGGDGGGSYGDPYVDPPSYEPDSGCCSVLISGPSQVCDSQTISLSAVGGPPGGTFSWTVSGAAEIVSGGDSDTVTIQGSGTGTASVQVFYQPPGDTEGCTAEQSVNVTDCSCSVDIVGANGMCSGQSVTLTALGTPAGGTYSWSVDGPAQITSDTSSASVTVQGTGVGTASVGVNYTPPDSDTSSQGCSDSYSVDVTNCCNIVITPGVGELPIISANGPTMPTLTCKGSVPNYTGSEPLTFNWTYTVNYQGNGGASANTWTGTVNSSAGDPSEATWTVPFSGSQNPSDFYGGNVTISVSVLLPGNSEPCTAELDSPYTITAEEPSCDQVIGALTSYGIWYLQGIAAQESGFNQFVGGYPYPNSTGDGGFGIMQVTPANAADMWNWRQNIADAVAEISNNTIRDVNGFRSPQQFWQDQIAQWQAWAAANPNSPYAPPPPDTTYGDITFSYTNPNAHSYADAIAIKRYNGSPQAFISWHDPGANPSSPGWQFSYYANGANYVAAVCTQYNSQCVPTDSNLVLGNDNIPPTASTYVSKEDAEPLGTSSAIDLSEISNTDTIYSLIIPFNNYPCLLTKSAKPNFKTKPTIQVQEKEGVK